MRCAGAAACTGKVNIPFLDGAPAAFAIPAGKTKTFRFDVAGPLHGHISRLTSIKATLTQGEVTTVVPTRLIHTHTAGGPSGPGSDAPTISPGPATRYQAVRDPRGDAHSSFQTPQLFDITLATAKRQGDAVVFTVVSTSAITQHDGYGNPIAPCVEIPWASAEHYSMVLFGNGQLSGYTQHVWPKMKTSIHGTSISWTVPRTVLARKGFTKGLLWRATGVCDVHHLADVAPNVGFATFRWVKVS